MRMFRHIFPFLGYFPAGKYTDLELSTPEIAEGVPCHKVVMAAVSKKLEMMIDKRGGNGHLVVRNIRFDILQKVVEFVYTGSVEVNEGVDKQDFIDALDMLLIKFEGKDEVNTEVGQTSHGKLDTFLDAMDSNDENENMDCSRISSVGIPVNEFNKSEEVLNLSTCYSDTSKLGLDKSRATSHSNSLGVSLGKTTSPDHYTSEDSANKTDDSDISDDIVNSDDSQDDSLYRNENDVLEGSGSEVGENFNNNLPEILSPCVPSSFREPVPLKKLPATHRERVAAKTGERICSKKLWKKQTDECTAELTRNEKIPEDGKVLPRYLVNCDFCDIKLSYAWYSSHLKNQHPTESMRRIKCENCLKDVPKVMLKHHKVVFHSNDKAIIATIKGICKTKVKCDECGQTISYKHLSRHYQVVHPRIKLHREKCGSCGMMIQQVKLKYHLKLVHEKIK